MPVTSNVELGENVAIHHPDLVNLYGCSIVDDTRIGTFVEIRKNARIEARCKISSHTFICEGVTVEDEVLIGHGVMFINDSYPRATIDERLQTAADGQAIPTLVKKGASIIGHLRCDRLFLTAWHFYYHEGTYAFSKST
jgi:UDP-2-acetamido-3-amino-2,3-dideoxy-glucuronate N-acetyltransferase